MNRIKSVKVWSREDMDDLMIQFGLNCFNRFKFDVEGKTYGDDWKECIYSNEWFVCYARLSKSGQASMMVSVNEKTIR